MASRGFVLMLAVGLAYFVRLEVGAHDHHNIDVSEDLGYAT
jgi:hypothetical protein